MNNDILNLVGGDVSINGKSIIFLGEVVFSSVKIDDDRLLLANGQAVSQTGKYSKFCNYLKQLKQKDSTNVPTCSQNEFDSEVSAFGQSGKYVIDDENEIIRVPKITEFIASANENKKLGSAELDEFKSHEHDIHGTGGRGYTGVSTFNGTLDWGGIQATGNGSPNGKFIAGATSGGSETKPKNIRYYCYIVVDS